jgi:hypothetical protein
MLRDCSIKTLSQSGLKPRSKVTGKYLSDEVWFQNDVLGKEVDPSLTQYLFKRTLFLSLILSSIIEKTEFYG